MLTQTDRSRCCSLPTTPRLSFNLAVQQAYIGQVIVASTAQALYHHSSEALFKHWRKGAGCQSPGNLLRAGNSDPVSNLAAVLICHIQLLFALNRLVGQVVRIARHLYRSCNI